jgi:hypothetical protein
MSLKLTDARYDRVDGYPVLIVTIDGREARVAYEIKANLLSRGIVFLGDECEDTLEPLVIEIDGHKHTLRGCTDDPRVFAVFRSFLKRCNEGPFVPGPVAI